MTSCTLQTLNTTQTASFAAGGAGPSTRRSWRIAIRWAAAGAVIAGAILLWLLIQNGTAG